MKVNQLFSFPFDGNDFVPLGKDHFFWKRFHWIWEGLTGPANK